ncbi:MAG: NAD-dependent epimerase/dehydratase family protein [Gammaproteobacteria bacterium]
MSRLVAVTGASGFIGGCLVRRLLASGWRVRALSRSPSSPAAPGATLQWVRGSLEDRASLRRLVAGAAAVIHCAGAVRGLDAADFEPVNVQGVARLVEAALDCPAPPRLLALSSLAAREPALSPYAASKRHGEEVLAAANACLQWTALRPPAVYGPGDRELLPLFRLMAKGVAPILGPRTARFSLLYVEDLAGAALRWLGLEDCPRGVYELHDGRAGGYSWDEVVDIVATLRNRPVVRVPVPGWLLRAMALLSTAAARIGRYPPMLTLGKVHELRHPDWVCDDSPWRAVSGWTPTVAFPEGIRMTLAAAATD